MAGRKEELGDSLKLIAKTSMIVFIGVALSKILGYVYRIIIARYYGPEVYGLFSLALMVSGWFIAVSALGLSDGLLRFIPLYRGKNQTRQIRYLINFSLIILGITSIISGVLLFFLSNWISINIFHNAELIIFLKIFSFLVPISVLSTLFLWILRAFEEISWYSFSFNIFQNVIKVSFLVLFIFLGLGSNAVSFSYLAGLLGMLVLTYIICRYKLPTIFLPYALKDEDKKPLKKELLSYSIPLMFFGIVSIVFYWIDSFSLGFYKSAVEVGFYNAAIPIAMLLGIAPELFMQLFFPMITREYSRKNLVLIEQLSKQVAKWIFMANIPIFAILMVFPGAALNILFGSSYLAAENALRILSIGALITSITLVSNNLISMIGKSKLILTNIVIASIVNLILNSIFVPMPKIWFIENSSGLNGAALATLISVITFSTLFMIETYRNLSIIPVRRKMITLFLIAIAPTILLIYLRTIFSSNGMLTLGLLGGAFVATYILLIFAFKALDENDVKIVKDVWKKTIKH